MHVRILLLRYTVNEKARLINLLFITTRLVMFSVVLIFFQAEDGIRDIGVTGVQTCALPIGGGRARRGAARLPLGGSRSLGRLGPVSSARRRASTPGLSTWWSPTALMRDPVLRGVSRLDAFSGYPVRARSEEHTSELQSRQYLVCRLLLEKKKQLSCTFFLPLTHVILLFPHLSSLFLSVFSLFNFFLSVLLFLLLISLPFSYVFSLLSFLL